LDLGAQCLAVDSTHDRALLSSWLNEQIEPEIRARLIDARLA
jgi:hypothetical protein